MYVLRPDEKTTPVMIYSQNALVRGNLVTRENIPRVSVWLRTQGIQQFAHLLHPTVLIFGGATPRSATYTEIFFPTERIIAFHLVPPVEEPLDYDPAEENRTMHAVDVLVGTFVMKGKVRISTHAEIGTTLEVARISWMSVYEVEVTNPYLPQMPPLHVPMMLVDPRYVTFGLMS
ncbi:MAG TPA: hypothetical protein VNK49_00695 [Anaerolineales bacterium]|nr:hypothetical protein [Anaerolineales bacterium]